MNKIKIIIILVCYFKITYSQSISSENLKKIIQNTTLSVFESQKLLLSNQKNDAGGKLSKSVFCQLKAISLFKENNLDESLCYTLAARGFSEDIINLEGGKLNEKYKLSDFELNLKSKCKFSNDFFEKARVIRMEFPNSDIYFIDIKNLLNSGINENY